MKNIFRILLLVTVFTPLFTSCEDWLDKKDSSSAMLSEDQIFADPVMIENFAFRMYDAFGWWLGGVSSTDRGFTPGQYVATTDVKDYNAIGVITGECMTYRSIDATVKSLTGDWQTLCNQGGGFNFEFGAVWANCWEAIYVANTMLDRIDGVESSVLTQEEKNQYKGEAYAFRAMAYFELFRRWGEIPYFNTKMNALTDVNIPKSAIADIAQHCSDDCDKAVEFFSEAVYTLDDEVMVGRIGKAAPMSLKALIWATAASPKFNTTGDADVMWGKAAQAALDVINLSVDYPKQVGLYDAKAKDASYSDIFYSRQVPMTIEACWPRWYPAAKSGRWTAYMWATKQSIGYRNVALTAYCPTQNIVDLFEDKEGYPIHDGDSKYNDQKPYSDRDPRLDFNVWHHASTCVKSSASDNKLDMREGVEGKDMAMLVGTHDGNSCTGYYIHKMVPDACSRSSTYANATYHGNVPRIRMAEMYLVYAEAINETKGPSGSIEGSDMTAIQAMNKVRARVGHADVPSKFTGDAGLFRERIHNEYAVEFLFENHFIFDLIRWGKAKDWVAQDYKYMKVGGTYSAPTYTVTKLPLVPKNFEDKHYRFPFPIDDVKMYTNLTQNPGW